LRDSVKASDPTHTFTPSLKAVIQDRILEEDPREAILKHAREAEENPYFIAPAYKKNQPKTVYAEKVYEDEEEERQERLKKRRQ
jgi:hypothetical protein